MQSAWSLSDDQLAYLLLGAIAVACFWLAARLLLRPAPPDGSRGGRIAGAIVLIVVGLVFAAALLFLATFTMRMF